MSWGGSINAGGCVETRIGWMDTWSMCTSSSWAIQNRSAFLHGPVVNAQYSKKAVFTVSFYSWGIITPSFWNCLWNININQIHQFFCRRYSLLKTVWKWNGIYCMHYIWCQINVKQNTWECWLFTHSVWAEEARCACIHKGGKGKGRNKIRANV